MLNKLWPKLFDNNRSTEKKSVRQMGKELGAPKSTVHYHQKQQQGRNRYPESEFWETEAGQPFLKRLIVSVIYTFGIKGPPGRAG